jgi:predicted nucleic acid-binding Zn ribbon protein
MTTKQHHCQECGAPYTRAKHAAQQSFCSTECRKAFNNRRMRRGAVLYDLYMGARYQRATLAGNISTMATVARVFREEDEAMRAGRPSWTNDSDFRDTLTEVFDARNRAVRNAKAEA